MVDGEQRRQVAAALSQLLDGQLKNDEFDDLYAVWAESPDRGVSQIASFGFSLYSSDLPVAYRLTGRYAVDAETRQIGERCFCFLRTGLEYAWPDWPNRTLVCAFGGLAMFLLIPLGIVLLIASLINVKFAAAGILVLLVGYALWRGSQSTKTPEWDAFWAHGDKEAWPFLHLSDWEREKNFAASQES